MTNEELMKELDRLYKWWRKDAAYRAPEDPLRAYAFGRANAYCAVLILLETEREREKGKR